jgi:hypothetical protein
LTDCAWVGLFAAARASRFVDRVPVVRATTCVGLVAISNIELGVVRIERAVAGAVVGVPERMLRVAGGWSTGFESISRRKSSRQILRPPFAVAKISRR